MMITDHSLRIKEMSSSILSEPPRRQRISCQTSSWEHCECKFDLAFRIFWQCITLTHEAWPPARPAAQAATDLNSLRSFLHDWLNRPLPHHHQRSTMGLNALKMSTIESCCTYIFFLLVVNTNRYLWICDVPFGFLSFGTPLCRLQSFFRGSFFSLLRGKK